MEFTMMVYKLSAWCDIAWRYSQTRASRTNHYKNRVDGDTMHSNSWYYLTLQFNQTCIALNWMLHQKAVLKVKNLNVSL